MVIKKNKRRKDLEDMTRAVDIKKMIETNITRDLDTISHLRNFNFALVMIILIMAAIIGYYYTLSQYATEQFCWKDLNTRESYVKGYGSRLDLFGGGSISCSYGYFRDYYRGD